VIQLLKWKKQSHNGKNAYNNNIHVDFETGKVDFVPIKWHKARTFFIFLSMHIIAPLSALKPIIIFTICSIALYVVDSKYLPAVILAYNMLNILVVWFIASILASLIYFNKTWRENYYPKYNATLAIINSTGSKLKVCRITPDKLYHNMFIIPKFSNVFFKYEMEGDFASYAKRIDVIALKKLEKGKLVDDPMNFKLVVTFKKPVKTGYMKIKYI